MDNVEFVPNSAAGHSNVIKISGVSTVSADAGGTVVVVTAVVSGGAVVNVVGTVEVDVGLTDGCSVVVVVTGVVVVVVVVVVDQVVDV